MIYLVTGGSGSGKSAYGERLILSFGEGQRIYIATMDPGEGEEGRARIARHRRMRRGKAFTTIERLRDLGSLRLPGSGPRHVLLECVPNLAANEMFGGGAAWESPEALVEKILGDIRAVARQAENLVIVSGQIGEDGCAYDRDTRAYIYLVGRLNQALAALAGQADEVVFGIPVRLKGEKA